MSKSVKKFFAAIKAQKEGKAKPSQELTSLMLEAISAAASAMTVEQLKQINAQLQKINRIVFMQKVLAVPFIDTSDKPDAPAVEPDQTRKAMMDGLEQLVSIKPTTSGKDAERVFLLHRVTDDFEYEQSASPFGSADQQTIQNQNERASGDAEVRPTEYKTTKETEWLTTFVKAETMRKGNNPIISAWIPESQIMDVKGASRNSGAWGNLGANPQTDLVRVCVKPGHYQLYAELKA